MGPVISITGGTLRHKPQKRDIPADAIPVDGFLTKVGVEPKDGKVTLELHYAEQSFPVYITPQQARAIAIKLLQVADVVSGDSGE